MPKFRAPNHESSLKAKPEEARLVGVYITTFATVELSSIYLFSAMMRCPAEVSHLILHQMQSFSHRLNVLSDLAAILGNAPYSEVISRLKSANSFRNKIAHSYWALGWDNEDLFLLTNPTRKEASKPIPMNAKQLAAEIEKLEVLNRDLETVIPNNLRWRMPSPDTDQ